MKTYEVLNIDDDFIGSISTEAVITDFWGRTEIWELIRHWAYFQAFMNSVVGGNFVTRYENSGPLGERLDIVFEPGPGLSFVVGCVRIQRAAATNTGLCARCAVPGAFIRTALICPNCKALLGGF